VGASVTTALQATESFNFVEHFGKTESVITKG
jgi:hypothetical protein